MDIEKGATWIDGINQSIQESNGVGIFFVSKQSLASQWLLFEAGSIASLGRKRVCVVLVDVKKHDVPPPLGLFQSTALTESDLRALVKDLNELASTPVPEENWNQIFSWAWPAFQRELLDASSIESPVSVPPSDTNYQKQLANSDVAFGAILEGMSRIEARLLNVEESFAAAQFRTKPAALDDARRELLFKLAASKDSTTRMNNAMRDELGKFAGEFEKKRVENEDLLALSAQAMDARAAPSMVDLVKASKGRGLRGE